MDALTAIAETAARRICGMFGEMDHYHDDIAAQVAMAVSEGLPRLLREQAVCSVCGHAAHVGHGCGAELPEGTPRGAHCSCGRIRA